MHGGGRGSTIIDGLTRGAAIGAMQAEAPVAPGFSLYPIQPDREAELENPRSNAPHACVPLPFHPMWGEMQAFRHPTDEREHDDASFFSRRKRPRLGTPPSLSLFSNAVAPRVTPSSPACCPSRAPYLKGEISDEGRGQTLDGVVPPRAICRN